jgi:hypothetical protein
VASIITLTITLTIKGMKMSNEVATQQANTSVVEGYSSIKGTDFETRKAIYTAVTNAESISDHLDEVINLKDIIVQPVTTEDDKGVVESYLRTVLIDDQGKAFATGSEGVITSLNTLFKTVGEPSDWKGQALPIKVVEEKGRKGYRYMTIKLA